MSFLKRAGAALDSAKSLAAENAKLIAQATWDGTKVIADGAVEAASVVSDTVSDKLGRNLPDVLDYLLDNEMDRLLLADAIASAESDASENTTWDDILKAALLDLKSTPAGKK